MVGVIRLRLVDDFYGGDLILCIFGGQDQSE